MFVTFEPRFRRAGRVFKQQLLVCLPGMCVVGLVHPKHIPEALLSILGLGLIIGLIVGRISPSSIRDGKWILVLPFFSCFCTMLQSSITMGTRYAVSELMGYHAASNEVTVALFASAPAAAAISYIGGLLLREFLARNHRTTPHVW